ncbi:MAG: hypothetical protein ACK4P3_02870 [Fimbriimonadaceae bacterium]
MTEVQPTPNPTLYERMQSVPRGVLYIILLVVTSVPLFFSVVVPTQPTNSTVDFYQYMMNIPQGSTIVLESDWTNSTRGESLGQMEALLRLVMERDLKFVLFSAADPQAPQVARDVIVSINAEREALGLRTYRLWDDWIDLGYFPNLEGFANAMVTDVRRAWAGRTNPNNQGIPTNVFQSPVLSKINSLGDFPLYINITGSRTIDILIERMSGRVTLAALVTGVMAPETLVYYESRQLVGMIGGLRGTVELETVMAGGVNFREDGRVANPVKNRPITPPLGGPVSYGRGMAYFLSLQCALALMIIAVVVGNVGMIMARRARRRAR